MSEKKQTKPVAEKDKGPDKEIGYIKPRGIIQEMEESYLDYAMTVIISRALPDVRDGLKPVHRRILYAMHSMGLRHNVKFRKSATVVGETLGKYHPHGDMAVYDSMVRMAQDFSLRYPLVKGQGNFGCFTKDTKVKLTDGRNLSFGELIKEHKEGKEHWAFSFNTEAKKAEIAKIEKPRLTRKHSKLMEVVLDNGEKIECTLDHRFMLRNGSYRQAQNLKAGDSLMPLYTKIYDGSEDKNLKGYETVFQPTLNKWEFFHHLADQWNLEDGVYEKRAGKIRHHKDFNKLNNDPSNIIRIQWGDHWKLHKEIASSRHYDNPEYIKSIAKGREQYWADEKNKKKHSQLRSEKNKVMWNNPKYREAWILARKTMWKDPSYKEFMRGVSSKNMKTLWGRKDFQVLMSKLKSQEMKKRWQDETYRAYWSKKTREISLKIWADPKHREHMSRLMKERMNDPEEKKKTSKRSKQLWKDPAYRAKYPDNHFSNMAKKLWEDPKMREFHREKTIKQWQDPKFREKVTKAISARNKQRLKEQPDYMLQLAEKAKVALRKNWQDPLYKEKVIKSKILGHVNSLLGKYLKVTPEVYEKERTSNNGVPRFENAIKYFDSFSQIVQEAKTYNHKVVSARILQKREDVYDLTCGPWHNFLLAAGVFVHNSVDGDSAAASRYTEAKLSKIGEEILSDIDRDTVDFRPNYDATRTEPVVLPSPVPQLLLNGSLGIAVGMATNIPPHNITEVLKATIYLIDHPKANTEDLFEFVKGPDFPTGGIIYNKKEIIAAYSQGRGPILARGKTEIKEQAKGNFRIIISEIPFQVQKSTLVQQFAKLVETKKIDGIRDIRDESDREGMRIVIELKKESFPKKVLNALYKYSDLQKTFHLNMMAIVDGIQPKVLSLVDVLNYYLIHKQEVVVRRAKFDLKRAKEKAHILDGLMIALKKIDQVIQTIKKSENKEHAHKNLRSKFKLSAIQASAILEMRLQSLAKLERDKIKAELDELKKLIQGLLALLKSPAKIKAKMKKELSEMEEKYRDERKTRVVVGGVSEIADQDLIPKEEAIIMLTQSGYIKRMKPATYKVQKRGGKGMIGMDIREEDGVEHFLVASTLDKLLFFADSGKVFQSLVWEIPEMSRVSKGRGLLNFLEISATEKIQNLIPYSKSLAGEGHYLVLATKNGIIKKTELSGFDNVRRSGLIAIKLQADDHLQTAKIVKKNEEIILVTKLGKSIKFTEKDVRAMGRSASGVRGIKLSAGDEVIGMSVVGSKTDQQKHLLVIMENGYGKRTKVSEYRLQKRGGSGIKAARINEKTGKIVYSKIVGGDENDLIVISNKGQVIKTTLNSISIIGRASSGVRVMKLKPGDKVASALCL